MAVPGDERALQIAEGRSCGRVGNYCTAITIYFAPHAAALASNSSVPISSTHGDFAAAPFRRHWLRLLSHVASCVDDTTYADGGWRCANWVGYDCSTAASYHIDASLLQHSCPLTCGSCHPKRVLSAPSPLPPAPPPLPPGVDVATPHDLRAAIGPGNSTLFVLPGTTYALNGTQLTISTGATVTIATRGHGPRAVVDGRAQRARRSVEAAAKVLPRWRYKANNVSVSSTSSSANAESNVAESNDAGAVRGPPPGKAGRKSTWKVEIRRVVDRS
jgi:hypothetical protein